MDHLITDPPYFGNVNSNAVHTPRGQVDKLRRDFGFDHITSDMPAKVWQVLPIIRRWSLVFSDTENAHHWQDAAVQEDNADHRFMRTMFWHKLNAQPQITGDRPAAHVEAITVGHAKGKSRWHGGGHGNLLQFAIARGFSERFDHGTPKPLRLMRRLISLFTDPGEIILDPFGGTGTTAKACKDLGRHCLMIERDEKWCEVAANRLKQEILL